MALAPPAPVDLLKDVPTLNELPAADLRALADASEVRKVARAAPLFSEGQPAEGLYVIRTGEVKVTKAGRDGREQIIHIAEPRKPITEGVRFDGKNYSATAIAMRAATAILIPNAAIAQIGERRPGVLRAMIDLRARRADRTLALVSDLSLRTVPARLASFLCALIAARTAKGEEKTTLVRDLTTETVAGRLGTVREEISRGLAYLEREGAVQVTPDVIEVKDPARLEAIAYGLPRK